MTNEIIKLKITNWDKYNPKRDQTNYTWLRLNNDIAYDPKLFGLKISQKYAFILILCECSKQNKAEIDLNTTWLSKISDVPHKDILELIEYMVKNGMATARGRAATAGGRALSPDYTYERNERNDTIRDETNVLDICINKNIIKVDEKKDDNKKIALDILERLNKNAGKCFRPVESTLKPIIARLSEGYKAEEVLKVMAFMSQDDFFLKNPHLINPHTLCRKEKFPIYLERVENDEKSL